MQIEGGNVIEGENVKVNFIKFVVVIYEYKLELDFSVHLNVGPFLSTETFRFGFHGAHSACVYAVVRFWLKGKGFAANKKNTECFFIFLP